MSAQSTSSATVSGSVTLRWVLRVAAAVAVRPTLWTTALRQMGRVAQPGWWRHRPFLPLPTPDYLAFRSQTMYGGTGQAPAPDDVCVYLQWCRDFPHDHSRRAARRTPFSARTGES